MLSESLYDLISYIFSSCHQARRVEHAFMIHRSKLQLPCQQRCLLTVMLPLRPGRTCVSIGCHCADCRISGYIGSCSGLGRICAPRQAGGDEIGAPRLARITASLRGEHGAVDKALNWVPSARNSWSRYMRRNCAVSVRARERERE